MSKLVSKLRQIFYTSWLGNVYFELLLYIDRKSSKKYLSHKEVTQIIREYSLLGEGVREVKGKINTLIKSRSAEDYHKVLGQIEDMMNLAERKADDPKSQLAKVLRNMYVKKGTVDIANDMDRAKMIDQRIKDTYELHDHIEKRNKLRKLRKERNEKKGK